MTNDSTKLREQLAQLRVIDSERRCVVAALELFLPLAQARRILTRPPDVDVPELVSWGRLDRTELNALSGGEPVHDDEQYLVDALLGERTFLCVYYALRGP